MTAEYTLLPTLSPALCPSWSPLTFPNLDFGLISRVVGTFQDITSAEPPEGYRPLPHICNGSKPGSSIPTTVSNNLLDTSIWMSAGISQPRVQNTTPECALASFLAFLLFLLLNSNAAETHGPHPQYSHSKHREVLWVQPPNYLSKQSPVLHPAEALA